MRRVYTLALLLLVLLAVSPALAEPDSFGLGTPKDGDANHDLSVTGDNVKINSYAQVTGALAPGDTEILIATNSLAPSNGRDATTSFKAGELVMVLQTTGIVPVIPMEQNTPVDLGASDVGQWEFARLAANIQPASETGRSKLVLTAPLIHTYAANVTQVIRVPEYRDVTVGNNKSIVAEKWDGRRGGVLAFLATGNVNVQGRIGADGAGFRAGKYVRDVSNPIASSCSNTTGPSPTHAQKGEGVDSTRYIPSSAGDNSPWGRGNFANGGGGGICLRSGGGGGGNAGKGGRGGATAAVGGMGGVPLVYSMIERLTFGGGGGSGHGRADHSPNEFVSGGAGGGLIFIRAGTLTLDSNHWSDISASGEPGWPGDSDTNADASGGGGAGGTIVLRLQGTLNCNTRRIAAIGGDGGSVDTPTTIPGAGGGGGGGRILYQATSQNCWNPPVSNYLLVTGGTRKHLNAANGEDGSISSLPGAFPILPVPTVANPAGTPGGTTNQRQPVITGKAQAGRQVIIYLGEVEIGRTYADATSGNFSFTVPQKLADGTYKLKAAITYQGVHSPKSEEETFKVDATAPLRPLVTTLGVTPRPASEGMLLGNPDLTVNSTTSKYEKLPIQGKMEAGSTITVRQLSPDGTTEFAKLTFNDSTNAGTWTVSIHQTEGQELIPYKLEVTAIDAAGNLSQPTIMGFILDTKLPTIPAVTKVAGTTTVLINTKQPVLEGTADTGNEVELTLQWNDGTPQQKILKTTANGSPGGWSIVAPEPLGDFLYTLKIKARDSAGNVMTGADRTFRVDTVAPSGLEVKTLGKRASAATAGMLIGQTLDLTFNSSTSEYLLTVSGKVVEASTVTVIQRLGSSSLQSKTGPVDGSGNWSVDLVQPLNMEANYTLEVNATDAANNVSEPIMLGFKLDTKYPAAPSVMKVDKTVPIVPGSSSTCSGTSWPYVTTRLPLIQGKGEAKARVDVTLASSSPHAVPSTMVNGLLGSPGDWSVSPTSELPDASIYTLTVTVTDEAGNTSPVSTYCFAVDATPPLKPTSISFGSKPAVNGMRIGRAVMASLSDADPAKPTGTLAISGSAETNSTMSLKLIPLSAAISMPPEQTPGASSGTWSSSWPGLESGSYALEARVKDAVGNLGPPETIFFELDLIRPTITLTGRPARDTITTSKDAVFGFEPSEKVTSYRCNINGQPQNPCVSPLFYTVTEDTGAYTLEVWATDLAGNETLATEPAKWKWRVDSNQPTVLILNVGSVGGIPASGNATNSTSIEFNLQANKRNLRIDCKRDTEAWEQPCQCNDVIADPAGNICVRRYTGLSDTAHVLLAKAYSAETGAETPDYAWRRYEWEVDTKKPDTFVTNQPDAWKAVNFVRVEYTTPTEARKATFQCNLNGEVFPCSSPLVKSELPDREYTLRITATDAAGNEEEEPAVVSWTVDTQNPEAPVIQLPAQGARYKDLALNGTAAGERLGTLSVYLDDNEKTPIGTVVATDNDNGDWQLVIAPEQKPADGPHFVRVKTTDRAGNAGAMSEPVHFIMDNEPPTVQIAGPNKNSASSSASFSFTANEEGVTFQCKLDLNDLTDCGANVSFSNLEEGPHTLNVYALDAAGNRRESSYSWSVYLGRDIRAEGGGLGCSTASAAPSLLWLFGLMGLLFKAQHRGNRQ